MISYLINLRLTLAQWALVCLTAACGLLVAALKLQGTRLHKAQIEAISARIDLTNGRHEDKIKRLQDTFEREVNKYEESH